MWITHDGQTGIVNSLDPGTDSAEVHYVNAKGETIKAAIGVPADEITQAAYKSIPAPRRPDKAHAKRRGYL